MAIANSLICRALAHPVHLVVEGNDAHALLDRFIASPDFPIQASDVAGVPWPGFHSSAHGVSMMGFEESITKGHAQHLIATNHQEQTYVNANIKMNIHIHIHIHIYIYIYKRI